MVFYFVAHLLWNVDHTVYCTIVLYWTWRDPSWCNSGVRQRGQKKTHWPGLQWLWTKHTSFLQKLHWSRRQSHACLCRRMLMCSDWKPSWQFASTCLLMDHLLVVMIIQELASITPLQQPEGANHLQNRFSVCLYIFFPWIYLHYHRHEVFHLGNETSAVWAFCSTDN